MLRTRAVAGPVAVVVVSPAAAPLVVVAADKAAAVRAAVVVTAAAAARAEADKVAADAHLVVAAEAAKVVVDRAAVVVDGPLGVVVDKVVEEEADARLAVVAADPPVVVEWEVEVAVVDVLPAVVGAAATVNSLSSSGASRMCGAPLFY